MGKLRWAACMLGLWVIGSFGALAQAVDMAGVGPRIEQAHNAGDAAALMHWRDSLAKTTGQHAEAGKYAWYYLGYANYALGELRLESDDQRASACLRDAVAALRHAVKIDPDFAEALALLASSYGHEIALHPFKGMFLGPRADQALARARMLAPDNPRVAMIQAASDYYTPVLFGGDKQRGEQLLRKAIALFDGYRPDAPDAPRWGRAQAHFLLGKMVAAAGHAASARAAYRAALAIDPAYAAARRALGLPPAATP